MLVGRNFISILFMHVVLFSMQYFFLMFSFAKTDLVLFQYLVNSNRHRNFSV